MIYIFYILTILSSEVFTSNVDLLDQDHYDLGNAEEIFKQYLAKFGKNKLDQYDSISRFEIFKQNLDIINKLNEKTEPKTYGITQFTDLTFEEVRNYYMGIRGNVTFDSAVKYEPSGVKAPASLDYRQNGYVTPIKNQQRCGSCYAFSSIGNIEGQYAKKHNTQAIRFSEQQIVDCDHKSAGCDGGWPHIVFNSLAEQGGSMREEDYPYRAVKGQCMLDSGKIAVRVTGGQQLSLSGEESLKDALVQYGPLSITIQTNYEFGLLKNGIFKPTAPCQDGLHAVLLIGYGNDGRDDYWILKNSWGTTWGDQGFYRMVMGRRACSIGDYAATATIA